MKNKYHFLALLLVLATLLTGCGTPLYELTDEEEDMIVSYAAYAVSLHNTYQKDGLVTTVLEETETEQEEEESEAEGQETAQEQDSKAGTKNSQTDTVDSTGESVTLAEAIGHGKDLSVKYKGYTIADHYKEGKGYSINAEEGRTFLILEITMKNKGDKTVKVDNVSLNPSFRCTYNGTDTVGAEITFLTHDFATYEGSIKAGKSVKTVLLFSIPESEADQIKTKDVSLSVVVQGVEKNIKK